MFLAGQMVIDNEEEGEYEDAPGNCAQVLTRSGRRYCFFKFQL